MSSSGHPLPSPGWYPDPGGRGAYRWWSGTAWGAAITAPARRPKPAWSVQSVVLMVTALFLFGWVVLWVAIFLPLIMLNDADNGRFGHDMRTLWTPEVGSAVITAVVLLVFSLIGRERRLGRSLLVVCAALTTATAATAVAAIALHRH